MQFEISLVGTVYSLLLAMLTVSKMFLLYILCIDDGFASDIRNDQIVMLDRKLHVPREGVRN